MIAIDKEFENSPYILDKTTQSLSSLPFNFEDCKIKANQYVTADIFNNSIEKLYNNLMYIYRGCNVGNFDVFYSYLYSISSSNSLPYYRSIKLDNLNTFLDNDNFELSGSQKGVLLPYNIEDQENILFFTNRNTINCMSVQREEVSFIFKTSLIDPLSGDIRFKDISDIKFDGDRLLFIVDRGYSNIYKYNINNLLSNENIYQQKLFVDKFIGGIGDASEKNKFNGLLNLTVNDGILIVQDVNNKCFKIYDYNFNWLGTSIFIRIFNKIKKFDTIYLNKGVLYCGVGKSIYKFTLINNSLVYENEYSLANYFRDEEYIKSIERIYSNENIVYIVTNYSIKKVWLSVLEYVVGEVKINTAGGDRRAIWLAPGRYSDELDTVVVYGYNSVSNRESFSVSFDKTFFETILNNTNFNIYTLNDCLVNQEEYVQSSVILTKLKKIYHNTLIFVQNVKYKFFEESDSFYPIIKEKIYNQNFLGYTGNLEYENDFDIGYNEILQAEVINRCIFQILELQLIVLLYFINNVNDKVFLSPDPYINSPNVKNYVYFVDDSLILSPNPSKINIFEELSPGGGILTSLGGAPYTGINGITVEQGVNI